MTADTLLAGAVMAVAQGKHMLNSLIPVSTLGQPFEVLKTHLAANRHDSFRAAVQKTWHRGGVAGFYQGLMPWVSSPFSELIGMGRSFVQRGDTARRIKQIRSDDAKSIAGSTRFCGNFWGYHGRYDAGVRGDGIDDNYGEYTSTLLIENCRDHSEQGSRFWHKGTFDHPSLPRHI
jgi:hypothetical protein